MRTRFNRIVIWVGACLLIVGGAGQAPAGYIHYVSDLGPTGYFRLDETTGPTAFDSSGNNHHSPYLSHAVWNQTPGALHPHDPDPAVYANNGDIVGFATHANSMFSSGASPFSISIWVKPDSFNSGDWGTFLNYGAWPHETGHDFIMGEAGNNLGHVDIGRYGLPVMQSNGVMTAGAWNHIGVTYDGTTIRLFLNGKLDRSKVEPFAVGVGGTSVNNGALGALVGGGQPYSGLIDEFAYFKGAALNPGVMQGLADPAMTRPASGPQYVNRVNALGPAGYYRLDETTLGMVRDSSGHGRDAVHGGSPNLNQTPGALAPFDPDSAIGGNGRVVDFSGVAGKLFSSGSEPFSISLWVKPNGFSAWQTPLSYGPASPWQNALIIAENDTNDGRLAVGIYGLNILLSNGRLVNQQWNHIGITYDGGASNMLKLFLNGQLDNSVVRILATGTPTGGALGALYTGGQNFNGLIDEFAYFRYALGDQDMIALGTAPVPEPSGLVLLGLGAAGMLGCARRRRGRST